MSDAERTASEVDPTIRELDPAELRSRRDALRYATASVALEGLQPHLGIGSARSTPCGRENHLRADDRPGRSV
jgi:hypothetical protein